jgi:hypothetical protein
MPIHKEDEFDEGYDVDVKDYFKQFFTNKSFFWTQLKLLVTPEHEYESLLKPRHHSTDATLDLEHSADAESQSDDDEDEEFEVEQYEEIEAPVLGQTVRVQETTEEVDLKRVLYNKAVPLSLIKEFHQEREIIIHAPKQKKKEVEETTNATPHANT